MALGAPSGFANNGPAGAVYYDSAVRLIAKGDYKGATIELKNALQANPGDISARLLLGQTYLKLNQGTAAATELLRARRDGASDRFVLVPLGRAYLSLGLFERVLTDIRTTGEDEATAAELAIIRGHAQLALRRYDAAERSYRSTTRSRPDDPDPKIGLARILIARGDFGAAEKLAEEALKSHPKSTVLWFIHGKAALLLGNRQTAMAGFNRALSLPPGHTGALLERARLHIDAGRYVEADRDIVMVRGIDGRSAHAAFLHAVVSTKLGQNKNAEKALIEAEQILREIPADRVRSDPPTMLLFGTISYFRKNFDTAFGHLSAFLERVPHHPDASKMLASIALHRGQPQTAVDLLAPLAGDRQTDFEYLILYSDALIRTGRFDQASDLLDKTTGLAAPGTPAMSRLLNLRLAAGDNEEAIDILQRELARNPESVATALTLATTYMRERNFRAALATLSPVRARHPDNPVVHTLAGGANLGMENIDAARKSFEAALRVAPDYRPALENLGKLELGLGNAAEARRHFLLILEKDAENGKAMSLLAELDRRAGDMDGAIRWLETARTSSRDSKAAALKLIDVLIATNRTEEAVALASDLQKQDPADPAILSAIGRARFAAGQLGPAADLFRQLADRAKETRSTEWLYKAARFLTKVGDRAAARRALENALIFNSRYIAAHVALFDLDIADRKFDDARAHVDRVAALAPAESTGDLLHGRLQMVLHHYDEAARSYSAAFEKKPSTALAVNLYEARLKAGLDALGFALAWAKKNPHDRLAQRLLAGAYAFAGRADEGIALYERLLEDEPNNIEYLNNIAGLYQRRGDPRAIDFAKRAYDFNPAHPGLMDTYGWILVQRGQTAQGLMLLRSAQTRLPNQPAIRYHMAVALNALGQRDAARRELSAALGNGQPFDEIDDARALLRTLTGSN